MFRKLFILGIALFISSCEEGKTYDQKINEYNSLTNKSFSKIQILDFEESISYSNAAIKITDTIPIAFYLKGKAAYELNWLDMAEESFTNAIKLEGETSEAYKERAKVYVKTGNNKSLEDIDIYLESYPKDKEAQKFKKTYFKFINNNKEADAEFEKLLSVVIEYEEVTPTIVILENKSYLNKATFIKILIGVFLVYVSISFLILRPLVLKKAKNQIGGVYTVGRDNFLWILPIILLISFFIVSYLELIPNY